MREPDRQTGTSISYVRMMARELDLDDKGLSQLFAGTDLRGTPLDGIDRRIALGDLERIFGNALELSGNPAFGLRVGELLQLSAHGRLGLAVTTAATLGKALEALVRYTPLREDFIVFSLTQSGEDVALVLNTMGAKLVADPLAEMMMAMVQQMVVALVGQEIDDTRIELTYARPAYGALYDDYFSGPVTFNNKANRFIFPKADFSRPCSFADPEVHKETTALCERALERHAPHSGTGASAKSGSDPSDIRDEVISVFEMNKHQIWSAHAVAQSLGLSSRTLARRLTASGTSFRSLREAYLKQAAAQMLTRSAATIEETAFALGYDNSANFRRAFTRWYGVTPSDFRKHPGSG